MMLRNEAYSYLIGVLFAQSIRLSIHDHSGANKIGKRDVSCFSEVTNDNVRCALGGHVGHYAVAWRCLQTARRHMDCHPS
jgi:pyoverdine/dityrosine biosynthesis protein Dit1